MLTVFINNTDNLKTISVDKITILPENKFTQLHFHHFQILVISPQNIDDDVLILLADSRIRHLHLLQNRYTPSSICITPCNAKAWRIVKRDNSNLCVHLRVESTKDGEVLIQPEAPVYSIMYQTPKTQVCL